MKPQKERITVDFMDGNPPWPILLGKINYARAHKPLGLHTHEESMEFVFVVRGKQHYQVAGEEYDVASGELFFTWPGEPHSTFGSPEEKSLFYYILIDIDALAERFIGLDREEGEAIRQALQAMKRRKFKVHADMKRLLEGILACSGDCFLRATKLRNLVSEFLISAVESEKYQESAGKAASLQNVLNYIDGSLTENVSLPQLAEIAGLSLPRFKSSFRGQMGVPPREYILQKKVDLAKELLMNTDQSMTEIAFQLQFSSSQYFATVFRRFTCATPSEFRHSAAECPTP